MRFTWGRCKIKVKSEKGRASCNTLTEDCTKETGIRMSGMEMDTNGTSRATSTEVNLRMGKPTDEASMSGETERSMMETGRMESRKDKASGRTPKETIILENGKTQRHMGMGFMCGPMEISMKDFGSAL